MQTIHASAFPATAQAAFRSQAADQSAIMKKGAGYHNQQDQLPLPDEEKYADPPKEWAVCRDHLQNFIPHLAENRKPWHMKACCTRQNFFRGDTPRPRKHEPMLSYSRKD